MRATPNEVRAWMYGGRLYQTERTALAAKAQDESRDLSRALRALAKATDLTRRLEELDCAQRAALAEALAPLTTDGE